MDKNDDGGRTSEKERESIGNKLTGNEVIPVATESDDPRLEKSCD